MDVSVVSRTMERQLQDILTQVAPRREGDVQPRRVISVLCVRITKYVGLCEELEPPLVGRILEIYLQTVADSIGTFVGAPQGVLGEIVTASWNAVAMQADHAALAVSAALDMIERMDDVNRRLRLEELPGIGYGVGVNTGDALVMRGGRARREAEAVGDAMNIARLLAEAADAGEILVGEGTRVSLGDDIRVEPLGLRLLPGKQKQVRVFRVTGRSEEDPSG